MALAEPKSTLPSYAKDIKLNLGRVLAADGMNGLSKDAVARIALIFAFATKHTDVITAITEEMSASPEIVEVGKGCPDGDGDEQCLLPLRPSGQRRRIRQNAC